MVVLSNGNQITCEIKELKRGKLTVETDSMGTLQIEWEDVQQVTSPARFTVELETGERFVGTLAAAPAAGRVTVAGDEDETTLDHLSVVRIHRIRPVVLEPARRLAGRRVHLHQGQ